MPDLDLAAIRARRARWDALSNGSTPLDVAAQTEVDTLTDYAIRVDVPALLDRAARVDQLEAALRRADARHDAVARELGRRCRELMAARRDVEQAQAERDHWVGRFYASVPQRFVVGADCPADADPPPPAERATVRPLEAT